MSGTIKYFYMGMNGFLGEIDSAMENFQSIFSLRILSFLELKEH
jgi:hypothetical protein